LINYLYTTSQKFGQDLRKTSLECGLWTHLINYGYDMTESMLSCDLDKGWLF